MAHFVYPAGWVSPVPAVHVPGLVEYELLWDQLYRAINGDTGGTWSPSAFVEVGGSGFNLTGTGHTVAASARLNVASTGEIRVLSGGFLSIRSGGALDVYGGLTLKATGSGGPGAMSVESGASITLAASSTMTAASGSTVNLSGVTAVRGAMTLKASGGPGTLNVETGCTATFEADSLLNIYTNLAKVQSGGQVSFLDSSTLVSEDGATAIWLGDWTFGNGEWPQLAPARTITRRSLRLAYTSFSHGDTTFSTAPDAYIEISDMGATPCIRTAIETASDSQRSLVEFDDLPAGATITDVDITTKGLGNDPDYYTRFVLVKWEGGDDTYTSLSLVTADEHSSSGNWTTTTDVTTVTPTGSVTIDKAWHYGVAIFHPYAAAGTSTRIYDIVMTLSLSSLQH
jgi:hypothetical protein